MLHCTRPTTACTLGLLRNTSGELLGNFLPICMHELDNLAHFQYKLHFLYLHILLSIEVMSFNNSCPQTRMELALFFH